MREDVGERRLRVVLDPLVRVVEEELELGVRKVGEAEGRLEAQAALQPRVGVAEHPFHLRLVPEQQHRDVLSGLVVHLFTARGVKRRCSQLDGAVRARCAPRRRAC